MMCHSVVLNLRWIAFAVVVFLSSEGFAAGFQCEHQTGGVEPALICSDAGTGDGDLVARVAMRKMPRWGIHAGLTVIDFCLMPRSEMSPSVNDAVTLGDTVSPKSSKVSQLGSCQRRYCTDVKHEHSFFLNTVPFPIGWTSVSFWLGYQYRSFSVRCDALVEETEIQ